MKKLILAFIFFGSTYQLKAQQVKVNPADSVAAFINNTIKAQTDSWKQLTSSVTTRQSTALYNDRTALNAPLNKIYFRDNMPVAVLQGNSKMPVIKLDGHDKMPVMQINPGNKGAADQQLLKSLPASKLPELPVPPPGK